MRAFRDGLALEPDDARELWAHFSAWMDEHPGDLAGFATALGVTSVRPALDGGGAVLVVSTTEAQTAYGNAGRFGPAPPKGKAPKATPPQKKAPPPPPGNREKGAATSPKGQGKSKGKPADARPKPKAPKQPR